MRTVWFCLAAGLLGLAARNAAAAWSLSPIAQSPSASAFGTGAAIINGQVVYLQIGTGGPVINDWNAGVTTTLLSTSTAIPLGTGNFSGLGPPSFDGSNVAFQGRGSSGQSGVYELTGGSLSRIADLTTSIPNQSGTFNAFSYVSVSGNLLAFTGQNASGKNGVYSHDSSGLHLVADLNTLDPTGTANYTTVGSSFASGGGVDFFGTGTDGGGHTTNGLYRSSGTSISTIVDSTASYPGGGQFSTVGDPAGDGTSVASYGGASNVGGMFFKDLGGVITNVADFHHSAPGFSGNLQFTGPGSLHSGSVVFIAGDGTRNEILTDLGGTLAEIVGDGDTLSGKTVQSVSVSYQSFDGSEAVIAVNFTDNTSGLYLEATPEPSSGVVVLVVSAVTVLSRRRRSA